MKKGEEYSRVCPSGCGFPISVKDPHLLCVVCLCFPHARAALTGESARGASAWTRPPWSCAQAYDGSSQVRLRRFRGGEHIGGTGGDGQSVGRVLGLAVAGMRGLWLHSTALSEREKTAIMDMLSLSGLFGEEAMAALEESTRRGAPTYQARGAPGSPRLKLQYH